MVSHKTKAIQRELPGAAAFGRSPFGTSAMNAGVKERPVNKIDYVPLYIIFWWTLDSPVQQKIATQPGWLQFLSFYFPRGRIPTTYGVDESVPTGYWRAIEIPVESEEGK